MLSKVKALQQIKATKIFTNREKAREIFLKSLNSYINDQKKLIVLMYYGVGGIGKSALLKHLRDSLRGMKEFQVVSIDLDTSIFTSVASTLLYIRNQLDIPCYAFEYALARYWQIEGKSLHDIQRQVVNRDSILFDLIDAAFSMGDIILPVNLLYKLAQSGSKAWHKWFSQEKMLIKQIDSLTESEIEDYLPYYLGIAIERAVSIDRKKFVFFIDSVEKLAYSKKGDQWLRELIGSSEHGLFVIAGREYLKWADIEPSWNFCLEQHILGELSDTDAEYFLSKIPIDDEQIRRSIIETARGVPFYLDLCSSIYMMKKQAGQDVSTDDFEGAEKEVIKRFFSHLDREQAEALKIVSAIGQFDYLLFVDLMKELSVGFPVTLFKDFCETSFATEINRELNIFKIHDIVREFVYDEMDVNSYVIMEVLLRHCERNMTTKDVNRISWVYRQAIYMLYRYKLILSNNQANMFVKVGLFLIDKGAWKEVESSLASTEYYAVNYAKLRFLQALCFRKRGALRDANDTYQEIMRQDLSPWTPLVQFHAAHVSHLLGNYDAAYKVYRGLMELDESNDISKEAKLLAIRQGADILMLKGKFRDALNTFTILSQIESDEIWKAEVSRFQGHVYRFNFELAIAERYYNNAFELAKSVGAVAMEGKALTNLAETLCWVSPRTAIKYSDLAIEKNEQVNAPIEVGKALTAKSFSLALENPEEAISIAYKAESVQENNGYKSGVLFALTARGLALYSNNQIDEAALVLKQVINLGKSLGNIYLYYPLVLMYLLLKPDDLKIYTRIFQWLDFRRTELYIRSIVNNFKKD